MPRSSFVERSFNQLSMTTYKTAKQKPVRPRSKPQVIGCRIIPCSSGAAEASDAMAKNTRTWPTLLTSAPPFRQPIVNPRKYAAPMMPIETVGKLSSDARTGKSVPCRPCPVNRIDTPMSRAATGASTFFIGQESWRLGNYHLPSTSPMRS